MWYSIGGANQPRTEATWFTQEHVTNLNDMIGENCAKPQKPFSTQDAKPSCLTKDKFAGIFYDLELIRTADIDFAASFELAQKHGLKVMVSTPFTFPFNEKKTQAPGYPDSIVPMFTSILSDKNVNILAPQFYDSYGGFVPTDGFWGVCRGKCDFGWWKDNVPATTQIMPILRTIMTTPNQPQWKPQWSDIDSDFKSQVATIQGLCTGTKSYTHLGTTYPASDYKDDFSIFCRDNKYFLWVSA